MHRKHFTQTAESSKGYCFESGEYYVANDQGRRWLVVEETFLRWIADDFEAFVTLTDAERLGRRRGSAALMNSAKLEAEAARERVKELLSAFQRSMQDPTARKSPFESLPRAVETPIVDNPNADIGDWFAGAEDF